MASSYLYYFDTIFVKLSVLGLYYRIFGINRTYRIWIYILGGAQTILVIAICILQAVQCQPISKYFNATIPGTCMNQEPLIVGGELPSSLIDFAMVALAMVMIQPRQMPSSTKWRLRFLLGLGIL